MHSDGYEAIGTLYKKMDAEQITPRFRKRELVLEIPGRYVQLVSFELTGDRCELLDGFEEGEELTLRFRLRGREWTARDGTVRYFNSLNVFELRRAGVDPSVDAAVIPSAGPHEASPALGDAPPPSDDDAPWDDGLDDDDDIPF